MISYHRLVRTFPRYRSEQKSPVWRLSGHIFYNVPLIPLILNWDTIFSCQRSCFPNKPSSQAFPALHQPSFVCEQPSGFTHSGVYRHVARHKVACHSPLLHSTLSCFFDCNLSVNIDSVAFCRRPSFLINISFKYKWIGRSTWLQKQALNSHCNL